MRSSAGEPQSQQRRKRILVTDDAGWTHVNSRRVNANPKTRPKQQRNFQAATALSDTSIADIENQQLKYKRLWTESKACESLLTILETHVLPADSGLHISRCVCLGLGSIADGRLSSRYQLETLKSILHVLDRAYTIDGVTFQDPAFTDLDAAYLRSCGFEVVDDPRAFALIDTSTFLFAPHLERNVYAKALTPHLPALSVSSEVDTYLNGVDGADIAAFEKFKSSTQSRALPDFDRDTWCYFTNVFWLTDGKSSD